MHLKLTKPTSERWFLCLYSIYSRPRPSLHPSYHCYCTLSFLLYTTLQSISTVHLFIYTTQQSMYYVPKYYAGCLDIYMNTLCRTASKKMSKEKNNGPMWCHIVMPQFFWACLSMFLPLFA